MISNADFVVVDISVKRKRLLQTNLHLRHRKMADDEPEMPFPNISVNIANNQYVDHEIIGNTNMS